MPRRYTDLALQYKQETGNKPDQGESFCIWREKGNWYIDISNEKAIKMGGFIEHFDHEDYIEWLENRIQELKMQLNEV